MCVKHAGEQGTFKITSAWISPTYRGGGPGRAARPREEKSLQVTGKLSLHGLRERARRGGVGKWWNGAVERSKGYLGWNQFLFSHLAVRLKKLVCSTRVDLKQKLRGWRITLEPPWSLRSDTKSNVVVSYGGTREKSPLKDTLPKLERFGRNCRCSEMRGWEAQVGSLRRGAS